MNFTQALAKQARTVAQVDGSQQTAQKVRMLVRQIPRADLGAVHNLLGRMISEVTLELNRCPRCGRQSHWQDEFYGSDSVVPECECYRL